MKSVKKRYMILPILLFSIIMISPIIKSFTKNSYNIKTKLRLKQTYSR